ncbi:MAG: HAMP domain-containing protein [Desulfobacterales bacterium]
MIVICEDCGKKYRLDPEMIEFEAARFTCKACNFIIKVQKPEPAFVSEDGALEYDLIEAVPLEELPEVEAEHVEMLEMAQGVDEIQPKPANKGLGLRTKMLLLFLVIPLAAFSIVGLLLLHRMNEMAEVLTHEAKISVTHAGEELVKNAARSVASQCCQYLKANPELTEADIMADRDFHDIAVQRVGKTGYTALHAINPMTPLVHPNPRITGRPLTASIKEVLGENFDRWVNITKDIDRGENTERSGYYLWTDPDGVLREKFMALTPVEGTRYGIAATIYLEEFLQPITEVERDANRIQSESRSYFVYSLSGVLLLIAAIVGIYSFRLTRKVNILTEHARRISVGELDATLTLQSADELGRLCDAIKLMQDSIRIAIERLKKRGGRS